jgi:hypothetical protein
MVDCVCPTCEVEEAADRMVEVIFHLTFQEEEAYVRAENVHR